ncbi:hypothetical protein HCN44_007185 [Aphidius gifuensis]|uniref:BEN domain-containing protein n=1 Tax=Aphidius gifuensis TaxID=684658 RepID=A0A834XL05_APHGI|nr:hypothetical protein HCN44_007185 [Aphidius gifuensis]
MNEILSMDDNKEKEIKYLKEQNKKLLKELHDIKKRPLVADVVQKFKNPAKKPFKNFDLKLPMEPQQEENVYLDMDSQRILPSFNKVQTIKNQQDQNEFIEYLMDSKLSLINTEVQQIRDTRKILINVIDPNNIYSNVPLVNEAIQDNNVDQNQLTDHAIQSSVTSDDSLMVDSDVTIDNQSKMIKLYEDVSVPAKKIFNIKSRNPNTYAKELARIVFTSSKLATCSLTGRLSNAFGHLNREAKPGLDKIKLKVIQG